jgi:hypothetical protein
MTFSQGGTITFGDKTYNISQINSVFVKKRSKYPHWKQFSICIILVLSILGYMVALVGTKGFYEWFIVLTGPFVIWYLLHLFNKKTYALCFEMPSKLVQVYVDSERGNVEDLKETVITHIERGYFPNYIQKNS